MLHFLIGLAVCIWIVERVTHYLSERRLRRAGHAGLNYAPTPKIVLQGRAEATSRKAQPA